MQSSLCRLALFVLCVFAPVGAHAEGLFLTEDNLEYIAPEGQFPDRSCAPLYGAVDDVYRKNRVELAPEVRERALKGDFNALFALAALTRLEENTGRPPSSGAPAAFWEDWIVRMFGEKEAWYRLGVAASVLAPFDGMPKTELQLMARRALRKAADLGHPEAMYGMGILAELQPDPDFRMPEDPGFPVIPRNIAEGNFRSDESRYWMGAAATHGSSRANLHMGLVYQMEQFAVVNETESVKMLRNSMVMGNAVAARMLYAYFEPYMTAHSPTLANCKDSIYYFLLDTKMHSEKIEQVEIMAGHMIAGNNKLFPKACLTREQYEEAMKKAEEEFNAIKASMEEKKREHDALYARAERMLPELRAAFEAQAGGKC